MKLKSFFRGVGIFFFLTTTVTAFSQNLTNGLIGFYPFAGNADDFSLFDNHGVVLGATSVADRFGNPNSAYSFDGVDDFIQVPNSVSISSPVNELTKVIWVSFPEFTALSSDFSPLISKSDINTNSFQYHLQVSPVGIMSSCNLWDNTAVKHFTFNSGEWYMIATTLRDNIIKTYVNGILLGSTWMNGNMNSNSAPLEFGRDLGGGSIHFHGKIDDIWLYNRSLSEEEVSLLYYTSDGGTEVDLKVFLEGAYQGSNMHTKLNSSDRLPLYHPFANQPWNYPGVERVEQIPPNIVDWVLVDFRDAPNAETAKKSKTIARKAAFIRNDGKIVSTDGESNLKLHSNVSEGLFVVVRHRNHLAVMSATPLSLTNYTYTYDFTTSESKAFMGNLVMLENGIYGMLAGDGNGDGMVNFADLMGEWSFFPGTSGYTGGDYNMDGVLDNKDKNDLWLIRQGAKQHIP